MTIMRPDESLFEALLHYYPFQDWNQAPLAHCHLFPAKALLSAAFETLHLCDY